MRPALTRLLALALLVAAPLHAQISTPTTPTAVSNVNNPNTVITSGSYTPTANSLVVACATAQDADAISFTAFSSTYATGGWTTDVYTAAAGSEQVRIVIGHAIATGSPGAGTVSATWGSNVDDINMFLAEIDSGFDSGDPIAQFDSATAASGTGLTDNFASAPASASMLVSCGDGADDNFGANAAVPDTSWAELEEFDSSGTRKPNIQYRTGTTATQYGIAFSGSHNAEQGIAIAALEIQEPAAGGSIIQLIMHHKRQQTLP